MRNLLILLLILAAAGWTTFWIVDNSAIQPDRDKKGRSFFSTSGQSLEQYAQRIIATESYADPETWRRVNAVRTLDARFREIDELHRNKGYR